MSSTLQGSIRRQTSEREYESSISLLKAIKEGRLSDIRRVLSDQFSNRVYALTEPSSSSDYQFRTALMAAAERGHYGIFRTTLRAFNACFESTKAKKKREEAIVNQLTIQDAEGMTLTMIAAKSGNIMIFNEVLDLVKACDDFEVKQVLTETDYKNVSVLMHACNSGRSAMFEEVFKLMDETANDDDELTEQLTHTSGDSKTLLMHAASCGEQMTLVTLANTFRDILDPKEVRRLLKAKDFEGMTFLMHAANSGSFCVSPFSKSERRKPKKTLSEETEVTSNSNRQRAASLHDGVPISGSPSSDFERDAGDDAPPRDTSSLESRRVGQKESGGDVTKRRISQKEHLRGSDTSVVVLKTAFNFYTEFLWKEQVREQLKEKDSWGRTVLTHTVMSGHKEVFDSAFQAIRSEILDSELESLLAINYNDGEDSAMEVALSEAEGDMRDLVSLRHEQLKRAVAIQEKASSIQAKIQSFIPGKFIVVYQLILPELDKDTDQPLFLLMIMCALAPFFAFAGNLIAREAPSERDKGRKSLMSLLLAAPALFFWGVGTSSVAQQSFSWSESSSSAALAVATIVIPALDAFFASRLVGQWFDKLLCKRYVFSKKACCGRRGGRKQQSFRSERKRGGESRKVKPLRGGDHPDAQTNWPRPSSRWSHVKEPIDEGEENRDGDEEEMGAGVVTGGGGRDEAKEGGRRDGRPRDEEEGAAYNGMQRKEKAVDPFPGH